MVFYRENDGIKVCVFLTVRTDLFDYILKSDGAAEIHSLQSMSHDGGTAVIVHVDLHALYAIVEVLQVSFDLGVTGQLVARKVCIMRGPNEIVREGTIAIELGLVGQVVIVEGEQKVAEVVEADAGRRQTEGVRTRDKQL